VFLRNEAIFRRIRLRVNGFGIGFAVRTAVMDIPCDAGGRDLGFGIAEAAREPG